MCEEEGEAGMHLGRETATLECGNVGGNFLVKQAV